MKLPLLSFSLLAAVSSIAAPEFQVFSPGSFTAEAVSATQTPAKELQLSFDGRQNTFSMFERLENSAVTLNFSPARKIDSLALIQVGWGNWAHPATLEVTVNGSESKLCQLEQQWGNADRGTLGVVQTIPIQSEVSKLTLKVVSVYKRDGVGWGSIGEIGFSDAAGKSAAKLAENAGGSMKSGGPAITGSEQRKLRITPWQFDTVTVSGKSGDDSAPKDLAKPFLGKGEVVFSRLEGSRIKIEFKEPRDLKLVAFQQGSWGNWAKVRGLALSVDGGVPELFTLEPTADPQGIPINRKAKKLEFTIQSVYAGKGIMPWGGFSHIGEAEFESVRFSPAASPFPMTATALEFEFDVTRPVTVPVTALVTATRLPYTAPALRLEPGKGRYRIPLSDFREQKPYGIDWRACHIHTLELGTDSQNADPGFVLKSIRPVLPADAPEDPWYSLGEFKPPVREIDGKLWTEGMSYASSGRFGNSTYNGLLDEVVGDLWFHAYTGGARDQLRRQKFDLWIAGNDSAQSTLDSAKPWIITGLDVSKSDEISNSWTHMSRRMKLGGGAELTWLVSSLAPGFLADCNRPFTISSRGGGDIPKRSGAPNEDENRFFRDADRDGNTAKIGPTMVVTPSQIITGAGSVDMQKLSEPWIVAVWGGINRPTFWGDKAVGVLFTLDKGKVSWDRNGISLPAGRLGISTSFHGLLQPDWQVEQLRKRAGLLTGMLRNYPLQCREFYRVENDEVQILNEFGYEKWGAHKFQATDYAPLPPIFVWGVLSCKWGKLPVDRSRMIDTPTGPYTWNPGNRTAYSLPLPVNRHAAFPRNPAFREINEELDRKYGELPDPKPEEFHIIGNAWTSSYRPLQVGASALGSSYISEANRKRLFDTLRISVRNGFRDFAWIPRREVFSKRPYLASLWVDHKVSPAMFGDINSGVGASNYALYMYSKYSGDWSLAQELWPRVMDSIRFCEVVNDWAIPMTSAREGILFGGIDMDTIGFLGITAAERLARQVGTPADRDRLAYLRAKIAPATALRFNFRDYLDPMGKFPKLWVNGFSESGPNLEWAEAKSGVGMDHVAMMFCWQGQQPEMYQFLLQLPGEKYMERFQKEMMDREFTGENLSGWRKMPFNYTRTAAHLAMRSWLPGWDRTELERDYQFWINRSKGEKKLFNAGFFGVYQGSIDRVFLTAWEPASLGMLTYDRELRQLTAELQSDRPFTLEGAAPGKVTAISIDGKPAVLPAVRYDGEYFSLMMPPCHSKVVLTFAR